MGTKSKKSKRSKLPKNSKSHSKPPSSPPPKDPSTYKKFPLKAPNPQNSPSKNKLSHLSKVLKVVEEQGIGCNWVDVAKVIEKEANQRVYGKVVQGIVRISSADRKRVKSIDPLVAEMKAIERERMVRNDILKMHLKNEIKRQEYMEIKKNKKGSFNDLRELNNTVAEMPLADISGVNTYSPGSFKGFKKVLFRSKSKEERYKFSNKLMSKLKQKKLELSQLRTKRLQNQQTRLQKEIKRQEQMEKKKKDEMQKSILSKLDEMQRKRSHEREERLRMTKEWEIKHRDMVSENLLYKKISKKDDKLLNRDLSFDRLESKSTMQRHQPLDHDELKVFEKDYLKRKKSNIKARKKTRLLELKNIDKLDLPTSKKWMEVKKREEREKKHAEEKAKEAFNLALKKLRYSKEVKASYWPEVSKTKRQEILNRNFEHALKTTRNGKAEGLDLSSDNQNKAGINNYIVKTARRLGERQNISNLPSFQNDKLVNLKKKSLLKNNATRTEKDRSHAKSVGERNIPKDYLKMMRDKNKDNPSTRNLASERHIKDWKKSMNKKNYDDFTKVEMMKMKSKQIDQVYKMKEESYRNDHVSFDQAHELNNILVNSIEAKLSALKKLEFQ
ncbi:unnamed protein product [Moneuplotes crassus]|uniref:Uncharacterized protein n=1 Tax=Euplotes crassus TaxID=5936 RepID=A0AAD1YAL3_EUPCR|nr:unnamed protein product [Moneuplotes crassus]